MLLRAIVFLIVGEYPKKACHFQTIWQNFYVIVPAQLKLGPIGMNVHQLRLHIRRRIISGLSIYRRVVMWIRAHNRLKGKIVQVTKGATTAHIRIDIGTV